MYLKYFEEISKIPHCSENEKALSDYIVSFAKERGLWTYQDESHNAVVKLPASKGRENIAPVIIQGHIDMVGAKTTDSTHDFEKDPLTLVTRDGFLRANGTTLGADDGIAAAYALALIDGDFEHPPIEFVFTTCEEIGMVGVTALDFSVLSAKRCINIDEETEGEFFASCAGGVRVNIEIPLEFEDAPLGGRFFEIRIGGLQGGHSGAMIHEQRANANRLLARLLLELGDIELARIEGGEKDNAIPRDASAVIYAKEKPDLSEYEKTFRKEFSAVDPYITISITEVKSVRKILTYAAKRSILNAINSLPNGVIYHTAKREGEERLAETSANLGVVAFFEKSVILASALRSSVASRKRELLSQFASVAELHRAGFSTEGDYPEWERAEKSELRELFSRIYKRTFGKDAKISGVHAGLECGVFSKRIPQVDIIAFGPTILDAHTPNERLDLASAERMWKFLREILKSLT
ncbi:aminoacyl-histidine dipeptidase [Clostridia bacterium]|nr:aminoacyl-histidine dipeptidase [Clostridia bacterium]